MTYFKCPYCLTQIELDAEVCKACARDVAKVKLLQRQLEEANKKIIVLEQATNGQASNLDNNQGKKQGFRVAFVFFIIALVFQIISTVLFNFKWDYKGLRVHYYLTFLLIVGLILYLLKKNGIFNIWNILLLFFLEPFAAFLAINTINPSSLEKSEIKNIINSSFYNVIIVVILSLIAVLLKKKKDYYFVFSFRPFYDRILIPIENLERIDKIVLLILSIAASLGSIYKFLLQ